MTFDEQHAQYRLRCEEALRTVEDGTFMPLSRVSEAASYALMNGGKRVRAVLVLAVCEMLNGDFRAADACAAAIEMIHASSLIHDDLPCMDDDDMRRGKPSTHIAFGEATALLAGDLLMLEAFEVLSKAPLDAKMLLQAVRVLSSAAGARGMIYGQELDLKYEREVADEAALHAIHRNKTGALIKAAAQMGVVAAGRDAEEEISVTKFAENIGLVFQIVDDILDVTSTTEELGKPVGSDREQGKTTFVSYYGMGTARSEVQKLTHEATTLLKASYGDASWFLCEFAEKLAQRVN